MSPISYEEALRSVNLAADATVGIFTGPPGRPGSAAPNSGKQYCALKVTGKNQVGLSTAAADNIVGILQNKPQQPGEPATTGINGISNARGAGVIAAGDEVVPDATGRFVTGAGTGKGKRFIALEPCAGADQMFAVLIVG